MLIISKIVGAKGQRQRQPACEADLCLLPKPEVALQLSLVEPPSVSTVVIVILIVIVNIIGIFIVIITLTFFFTMIPRLHCLFSVEAKGRVGLHNCLSLRS